MHIAIPLLGLLSISGIAVTVSDSEGRGNILPVNWGLSAFVVSFGYSLHPPQINKLALGLLHLSLGGATRKARFIPSKFSSAVFQRIR